MPDLYLGYDAFGNIACKRDANGNVVKFQYDRLSGSLQTVVENALKHRTVNMYYGVDGQPSAKGVYGRLRTVTDPNGAAIRHEYDALGRLALTEFPDTSVTSFTYSLSGDPTTQGVRSQTSAGICLDNIPSMGSDDHTVSGARVRAARISRP